MAERCIVGFLDAIDMPGFMLGMCLGAPAKPAQMSSPDLCGCQARYLPERKCELPAGGMNRIFDSVCVLSALKR